MALTWIKSSMSFSNGNCVELASLPDGGVAVRNSRDPKVMLRYTRAEWEAFMDGVNKGEFDVFTR